MANQNYSIDQRLLNAQVAIDNSINAPDILTIVTLYGYDLARLQAARALYDEVMDLVAVQKREYGDQYEATAVLRAATALRDVKMDALDEWLADYKVVAQIAFDDAPQKLAQLGFSAG